jgi:beta-galactosidase
MFAVEVVCTMKKLFLLLLFLSVVIPNVVNAKESNLLLNGDFEMSPDLPGMVPGWKASKNAILCLEDGNSFINIKNDSTNSSSAISQKFEVNPNWKELSLTARVRVKNITQGKLSWHTARLATTLLDKEHKAVYPGVLAWKTPTDGWIDCQIKTEIPEGTTEISFSPAIFNSVGEMDVDDICISVSQYRNSKKEDSFSETDKIEALNKKKTVELKEGDKLYWDSEPIETVSATRQLVCLNGLWKFIPDNDRTFSEENEWGYINVPGSWKGWDSIPHVSQKGKGKAWNSLSKTFSGWYERTIKIPANWNGKKITLDFTRFSTDIVVFINDKKIGGLKWPSGEIDITSEVKIGNTYDLKIFVIAVNDKDKIMRFMGPDAAQITLEKATLRSYGLVGEVFLESRPQGATISDVYVKTSTRNNTVNLEVSVSGIKKNSKTDFTATIFNAENQIEKVFTASSVLKPTSDKNNNEQTVELSWTWADAKLWTPETPNLYTLKLQANANDIDDEYAQQFGFHEFWVEGRDFFLNGIKVRMRPANYPCAGNLGGQIELISAAIGSMKSCGFNLYELWPWDRTERGKWHFDELWFDAADRQGFFMTAPIPYFRPYLSNWDQPSGRQAWEAILKREMRKYRNHPSLVMWGSAANQYGFCEDQNPMLIGNKRLSYENCGSTLQVKAEKVFDIMKIIRKYDSRPFFTHAGSFVGDVYTSNNYLCLIPIQEREEWLSNWAEKGDMPVFMVEFGCPLVGTVMRGRHGYGQSTTSEPLATEFSAIYVGADAYQKESITYRTLIKNLLKDGQEYSTFHFDNVITSEYGYQEIMKLFIRNTWRSWRTYGISGGMLPWAAGHGWITGKITTQPVHQPMLPKLGEEPVKAFKPGSRGGFPYKTTALRQFVNGMLSNDGLQARPSAAVLTDSSRPIMAWIAGKPGAFTDKSHHFVPGEKIEKQIVLINDSMENKSYNFICTCKVGSKIIRELSLSGSLAPAEIAKLPISFKLPRNFYSFKTDGLITLDANIGEDELADEFSFRIYKEQEHESVAFNIIDPLGKTSKMLDTLGYSYELWDGKDSKPLIVGREALSGDMVDTKAVMDFVSSGGRAIVFPQTPEIFTEKLNFRISHYSSRNIFTLPQTDSITLGLDAEDLCNWTGKSSLIPVKSIKDYTMVTSGYPLYGWHWSNRGTVASLALEKPHYGSWRPILQCEFDLAYSPLMEQEVNKGKILWNTLDLEDHYANDPVAKELACRILDYVVDMELPSKLETFYMGDSSGEELLKDMGVIFSKTNSIPKSPSLLIVGDNVAVDPGALYSFLDNGGNALILRRTEDGFKQLGLELGKSTLNGELSVPAWKECKGLGISDLRWRTSEETDVLVGGCELSANGLLGRIASPNGSAIICQNDPRMFDVDTFTYLRYTRWRQTRLLSQLITNLGGSFHCDSDTLSILKKEEIIPMAGQWEFKFVNKLMAKKDNSVYPDPGINDSVRMLMQPEVNSSTWEKYEVPMVWENYDKKYVGMDGEAVYRKTVNIPESWEGKDLILSLGKVDDFDVTFWNGKQVGMTDITVPKFWSFFRAYKIPGKDVKAGKTVIGVRVFDHMGGGGMDASNKEDLNIRLANPEITNKEIELYHPDFRTDFDYGDDPYRYYRW